MSASALVCLAPGSEETEAVTTIDLLVRGGIKVTTASVASDGNLAITCSRGVKLLADALLVEVADGEYDVIVLNFANCDMVGHTGVFEAAVKAVETVDTCLGRVVDAIQKMGGMALITADHGNADQMVDYTTGGPFTAHTTNVVPLVLVGKEGVSLKPGRLADLAPTMLDLMGLEKPAEMTGESLIQKA